MFKAIAFLAESYFNPATPDFLLDLGRDLSPWFPVRLIRDLEQLLNRKVDVVTERGLKERIREKVLQEATLL